MKPVAKKPTVYDYTDEAGKLTYQVVRGLGKKKFMQRRPAREGESSDDGWIYSLSGISLVPYRLQDLANTPNQIVAVIVEGEKDANNLQARDKSLVATTLPGGANRKWEASWSPHFSGRDVIICPDDDAPGHKHARKIAENLISVASRVRIVNWEKLWPEKPADKKDISDWLEAHPNEIDIIERLHAAADDTPENRLAVASANGSSKEHWTPEADAENSEHAIWWEVDRGESFVVHDKKRETWSVYPQSKVKALISRRSRKERAGYMWDEIFLHVMEQRRLDLVLPALSGHRRGIKETAAGGRLLIRSEPKLIEPKPGEWRTISELVDKLNLGIDSDDASRGPDQRTYFHGWMKSAQESLRAGPGNFRPGQAVIFAGERDSYKSRFQHNLITRFLGGRSANPGPFLFHRTDFNGELFRAEHLLIEDPATRSLFHDRTLFGEQLKQLLVSDKQRLHDKFMAAIMVEPFFRVTISVNDDPEKMRVLPLLTPDMRDKIHLFYVSPRKLSFETATLEQRASFRAKIDAELPAYIHWLLNEFVLPGELRSARFGVKAFLHPSLESMLFEDTPASKLLSLIDYADWEGRNLWQLPCKNKPSVPDAWEGTAEELEQLLRRSCVQRETERLLHDKDIGRLLSRLEQDQRDRVLKHRTKKQRCWVIGKPSEVTQ